MMIMIGKMFNKLFKKQIEFQSLIVDKKLPTDSTEWFIYHVSAMMEEIGELLKSDKRWKTHRNIHFDKENKLEELADIQITLFNLMIFSDISEDELFIKVQSKISENTFKYKNRKEIENDYYSRR